jgi:hypothetical protein
MMTNWFYMDRKTFKAVLNDELGANLTERLISFDFDLPISFMIGETSDEILTKIQQTFTRQICHKTICTDSCISCSLNPPIYAKLAWFVQRLLIMSPLSKPFVKQILSPKQNSPSIQEENCYSNKQNSTNIKQIIQVSFRI